MSRRALFPLSLFALAFLCLTVPAQDPNDPKKVLGEVTVYAEDPIYKQLRSMSASADAFSGDFATVNNLVLKKDAGVFTLKSGAVYFLKPVGGRTTGAVFIGSGEFSLVPPTPTERKHLTIFTDSEELKEQFDGLTMFFTDRTLEEIKASPNAQMGTAGPAADKARTMFRDKEGLLRGTFRYNISSRMLSDVYAPARSGLFMAFVDGSKFGKLLYGVDPLGQAEIYPEQVELISYGESTGGIWSAFHMEAEYKNGTATSWQDRRTYDIKSHNIDATVSGTRISAVDEVTLQMREANSRFLPFDLFRTLRVKSVRDEKGEPLVFIQEKKDEDADFGVLLPAAIEVGKPFKLKIEYDGTEALRDAGGGNFILLPRSTWYPNNPASSFGDRAAFDLTFRVPKKNVLVGTGMRVGEETVEGDQKISKWSSSGVELAVAGFNYGDFKVKQLNDPTTGMALEVYTNSFLPNEMRDIQAQIDEIERSGGRTTTTLGAMNTAGGADGVLTDAQNAIRVYDAYFGKPPLGRVAMTQQPAANFGQAWPTLVYMPYMAFISDTLRVQLFGIKGGTSSFWNEVAPHEVAHQWWGHLVGWTSYRDQWMSEGFSEFSSSLFIQFVRKDPGKFNAFWEEQRRRIVEGGPATKGRKPYTVGPVTQGYRLNSAKTGAVTQLMIYPKGAFILQMLRMMMYDHRGGTADAQFQKMMRDFLASHKNQDVSTNDFKIAVEKYMLPSMDLGGNQKMDWFFDEWVYGTDMPSYKLTYSLSQSGDKTMLNGQLTQSGVSDTFRMPVPLYLDFGKGPVFMGAARITGNKTLDLSNIALPAAPKKMMIGALQDILADKVEVAKQ